MSSDDDTVRMEQSNGVPIEEIFDGETCPSQPMVLSHVEEGDVEEIDKSDGVPLFSAGMVDTEPSIPTTRVRNKNWRPN